LAREPFCSCQRVEPLLARPLDAGGRYFGMFGISVWKLWLHGTLVGCVTGTHQKTRRGPVPGGLTCNIKECIISFRLTSKFEFLWFHLQ